MKDKIYLLCHTEEKGGSLCWIADLKYKENSKRLSGIITEGISKEMGMLTAMIAGLNKIRKKKIPIIVRIESEYIVLKTKELVGLWANGKFGDYEVSNKALWRWLLEIMTSFDNANIEEGETGLSIPCKNKLKDSKNAKQ